MQLILTKYHYSFWNNPDIYSLQLTPGVILGMLKILFLISIVIFAKPIYRIIYNLFVFRNRGFTDDIKLIDFSKERQSNFKNTYGFYYQKPDLILELESIQNPLKPQEYQDSIKRSLLIEKVSELFHLYLKDWNEKNFDAISEYTLRPFSHSQTNNFDLVYNCNLKEIEPLKFIIKEELKRFIVQINGEITNFKLNTKGYVIRGQATPRLFTEYWDVALDADNKAYLVSIYQIKKSDRDLDSSIMMIR